MSTTSVTGRAVFGAVLKRYRRAARLSQEELAVRAGYSTVYISMIERGRRVPLPPVVRILANTLALSAPQRMMFEAAAQRADDTAARKTLVGDHPPNSSLIGRTAEVAALERHLAGLGPPVLFLAGEPGIGKTRLLQEAMAYGEACGWQVLQGGCGRRGGQEPYAPLLGALAAFIERLSPGRRELEGCTWLTRLLPELAAVGLDPLPPWTLPPTQERRLIANAVARFLSNVAGPAGSLLVLDDLQWAGPDALDLLAALVYAETPVRLIGAYRATEVGSSDALTDVLADLGRAGLATHVTLAPLASPEAGQLFDRLATGATGAAGAAGASVELRERVLRRAGGVPFFLVSYAQTLPASSAARSTKGADGADGADGAVPWDVVQSVRQRVAALPSDVRTLLDVAAVVGRQTPRALLVALGAHAEETTLTALAVACRGRLLEEVDDTYRFVHDVIREVIESDIGAGKRALLHRRVAEALNGMPGDPTIELLAYHYGRAGMEEQASRYLEQAGDRARGQAAHMAAAQYYREASARLEVLGRREDAARVRVRLGTLFTTAARYEDALRVLEEAAALYDAAHDLDGLGQAVAQIGHAHADQGTPEVGIRRLQTLVIPLARDGAARGLAALNAALASLFFVAGHYDEQLAAAEQAAELARTIKDSWVLLQARLSLGTALIMTGRSDEALPVLEETIGVAESLGDLDSLSRALTSAASIYINRSAFDKSMGYIDRALRVAERVGDPVRTLRGLCYRGSIDLFTGRWPRAR